MAGGSKGIGGGVVAIRGFAYQFDQTILAALDRPTEQIDVEHIEDLNGVDWCIQVKQYSGAYQPSVLTNAIKGLYAIHRLEPKRQLRLHCHFNDKVPGDTLRVSATNLPAVWKDGLGAASRTERRSFISKLSILFTEDLEQQFDNLLDRLRKDFALKSLEDALCTHAVLRAHIMKLATNKDRSARRLSLGELKAINKEHRDIVLECGHADRIGDEKYVRMVADRLFKRSFNAAPVDRFFLVDADNTADPNGIAEVAVQLSTRYYKRLTSAPRGRPPVLCVQGLSEAQHRDAMGRVFDALSKVASQYPATRSGHRDAPLVDGCPYEGSPFRLELLKSCAAPPTTLLRVLPPSTLALSDVLNWISSAEQKCHFWIEGRQPSALPLDGAARVYVRNVDMIARILA